MSSNESQGVVQVKSDESTETEVTIEEVDVFKDYSNKELNDLIEQTKAEYSKIHTENRMCLSFITNEDPAIATKIFAELLKLPHDINELAVISDNFDSISWLDESSVVESIYSRKSKKSLSIFSWGSQKSLITGTTETSGYQKTREQLSPLMKIEMTEKTIKHKRENIKNVIKASEKKVEHLSCKANKIQMSNKEIIQKLNEFQKEVATNGIDPITSRIPAETFLKFIRTKLKQDNTLTDKLRLRSASLRQTAKTIQSKLASKKQLCGILRPIDFEQLKIDKTQLTKSLMDKNAQFYGLKKVNGQISLACTVQKKALDEKLKLVESMRTKAVSMNHTIQRMKQEQDGVRRKIDDVQTKTGKLNYKMKHYRTPSVDDYCNKKEVLTELEKRNKMLRRENDLFLSKLSHIKVVNGNNKN